MPEVVEEDGDANRAAQARPLSRWQWRLPKRRVEDPGGHRHGSDRMGIAAVGGAGEGEFCEAELLDAAQPLHLRAVDEPALLRGDLDGPVNGIPDVHGPKVARLARAHKNP